MSGGKSNIRPEDGKQFSSTYQPKCQWTEKKAIAVAKKLIKWLKADDENIFYKDFLLIVNDYNLDLIGYLRKKFSSVAELLETAKDIQEIKLVKFGVLDRLNSTMTKFTLINNHGYADKHEIENNHSGAIDDLSMVTTEELVERAAAIDQLTKNKTN